MTVDSDPNKSTIETFVATQIAGALNSITIQSRDSNSQIIDSFVDIYTVKFTRSDGRGS